MKRLWLLLGFLFLFACPAKAQLQVPSYPFDPTFCDSTRGLQYFNTLSMVMKFCSAPNTWSNIGSGGAGTITGCTTTGGVGYENGASNTLTCDTGLTYGGAGGLVTITGLGGGSFTPGNSKTLLNLAQTDATVSGLEVTNQSTIGSSGKPSSIGLYVDGNGVGQISGGNMVGDGSGNFSGLWFVQNPSLYGAASQAGALGSTFNEPVDGPAGLTVWRDIGNPGPSASNLLQICKGHTLGFCLAGFDSGGAPGTVSNVDLFFNGTTSGTAKLGVAAAAGTPNPILLPTSTGSNTNCLKTDGNNPQQTSWGACTGTIAIPATVSGATSGGIPCFDSTSDMNTSVAIPNNDMIDGGGAGACAKDSGIASTNVVLISSSSNQLLQCTGSTNCYTIKQSSGGGNPFLVQNSSGVSLIATQPGSSQGQIVLNSANISTLFNGTSLHVLFSPAAPTVAAGGCGGSAASIPNNNGTASFWVNVGTSNTGTCTITMPAATAGWSCNAEDRTTHSTTVSRTTAISTSGTSVTLQNYTDITGTGAWTDSDVISVQCWGL